MLGSVFHDLARRKEGWIEEGHLMSDHVHILISIPPKYSVAVVIEYLSHYPTHRSGIRNQPIGLIFPRRRFPLFGDRL
ncbi:hypothetical protein GRI33_10810 [Brucella sp. BO3]|nr:hypothetical protein BA060_08920 [Brucella sp. B13-0095]QMV27475.1 hypothetical protein GRI33_10810 [Brucella sp. BO3]